MSATELQQTIQEIDADTAALRRIDLADIKGIVIRSGDGEMDRIVGTRGYEPRALRAVTYSALRQAREAAEQQLRQAQAAPVKGQ